MKKIFYLALFGISISCWKERTCECMNIVNKSAAQEILLGAVDDTTYQHFTMKGRENKANVECNDKDEVYLQDGDSIIVDCYLK